MYRFKKLFKWFLQVFSKGANNNGINTEAKSSVSMAVQEEKVTEVSGGASSVTAISDETIVGIKKLKEEIEKIKCEAKESLEITKDTRGLVFFGFFALIIVVIGIAFGYWEFIYTASKNDDYRYNISDKIFKNTSDISEVKNDLKELKTCLKFGGWNYCLSE